MGVANRIADSTIGRQVSVLRHAAHVANRVEADLRDLEAEILRRLQKIDLTKFQAVRLRRALAEVRGAAAEFAKTQAKAQLEDLTGVAEAATKAAARDINTAVRADLVSGGFNARTFVEAMDSLAVVGGNTLKEYWDAFPAQVTSDYAKVIRNGVATGQTMRQITAAAADVPNFSPLRRHLRTYVRTSVINVHNHARDIFYQENDDLIGGIQWLSTLDARTSNICKALDGLSWNMEYEPIGHSIAFPGNVAHPNCRSTQIPVLKSFEELSGNKALGKKLDESLSKSTRASMDGQVAEDIDYEHWLASKGDKFAREVLGPGRFELWKDGKLSFRDLVDQSARPKSLPQLQDEAMTRGHKKDEGPGVEHFPPNWGDITRILVDETEHTAYMAQVGEELLENAEGNLEMANDLILAMERRGEDTTGMKAWLTRGLAALSIYKKNSRDINRFVRANIQGIQSGKFGADNLPAALVKLHETYGYIPDDQLRLFRGGGLSAFSGAIPVAGDTFAVGGFFSTSYDLGTALGFLGKDRVVFDIRVPAGVGRVLPGVDREQELIFPHGSRFRVLSVVNRHIVTRAQVEHDVMVIQVELLP